MLFDPMQQIMFLIKIVSGCNKPIGQLPLPQLKKESHSI